VDVIDVCRRIRESSMVPIVIVTLVFQRRIVAGLTSGAVKG